MGERTEELLDTAVLLNNLNDTRLQLLNGRNVVGEDTHHTSSSGDVDLDAVEGEVDRGLADCIDCTKLVTTS